MVSIESDCDWFPIGPFDARISPTTVAYDAMAWSTPEPHEARRYAAQHVQRVSITYRAVKGVCEGALVMQCDTINRHTSAPPFIHP